MSVNSVSIYVFHIPTFLKLGLYLRDSQKMWKYGDNSHKYSKSYKFPKNFDTSYPKWNLHIQGSENRIKTASFLSSLEPLAFSSPLVFHVFVQWNGHHVLSTLAGLLFPANALIADGECLCIFLFERRNRGLLYIRGRHFLYISISILGLVTW